ncbi:MAG: GNAT family N-acetyltransferase [Chloroflexota bacterium]
MLQIFQVETDKQKLDSRAMLREYLDWLLATINREAGAGAQIDVEAVLEVALEEAMREDGKFAPPEGRMLLAEENGSPAGLICLRKIGANTGEVKRMYVTPAFRGKGVGRAMVERLCEEAREIGYASIRLDSGPFMQSAHAVYRAAGFHEINSYPESEVPPEYHSIWLFMELTL